MLRQICMLLCMLLTTVSSSAMKPDVAQRQKYKHGTSYIYRIYLTDKNDSPYSLTHPSRFLSRRSLDRRKRQHLDLDSTDLPVSPRYIRQIEKNEEVSVIGKSRWKNTLLVRVKDTTLLHTLDQLPFVQERKLVWQSPDSITQTTERVKYLDRFDEHDNRPDQKYGRSYEQIRLLQGQRLHDIEMEGAGMMIAVIDGGFRNVDRIPAFQRADIRGYKDFVCPPSPSVFAETDHGTKVLSAMALNEPFYYIGSAPKSADWLLRSEDQQTEQEVEEDYWVMAALNGQMAFISQVASMVAGKGMILINSAGNSGMGPWKKITVPADAENILTVGAVTPDAPYRIAPFSSIGPSQDGRVKPDVVAVGAPAFLVNGRGNIMQDMGTSFAAPIVCGLAACLWEALPEKTAKEIIELIRLSSNNYEHPDNIYGYGIPKFWRAYMLGKGGNE